MAVCAGGTALIVWAVSEASSWTTLLAPIASLAGVEIETSETSTAALGALVALFCLSLLGVMMVLAAAVWAAVLFWRGR
jgi:hypothetical protein